MPSPPHPCAYPGCDRMVARRDALHCRKHAVKTPVHVAKVAESLRGRRLSDEHRRKLSEARRGSGTTERTCQHCGSVFHVEKPSSKVRFCSRKCGYEQRQGENASNWIPDMPTVECQICGTSVRSASATYTPLTCSLTCSAIYKIKKQRNSGTDIERLMEAALIERGITFEAQVPLCNVTIADFYLPDSRTAIFCDGDYWHSLPEHVERDHRQTAVLEAAGYIVHRFTGSAIKADIASCLTAVCPV